MCGDHRRQKGYTLAELMLVVLIIGILSSIVYPSYSQYMFETRRSDAWIALSNAAAAQERWYSVNFQYTPLIENLGGSTSAEGFYVISVEVTDGAYTITATAVDSGLQANDAGCTSMRLDHFGSRIPSSCWK